MANDSTQLGYLTPLAPPPDYDQAVENTLHDLCAALTGIDPTLVRPRWQTWPGNTPDQESLWVSFGLSLQAAQWDPYISHDPSDGGGAGSSSVSRAETWYCNYSFYGLSAENALVMLRDGIALGQNRDILEGKGLKFIEFMEPVNVPALVKNTWTRRVDLKGVFSRLVTRKYQVRNLLSANIDLDNEKYHTFITTP